MTICCANYAAPCIENLRADLCHILGTFTSYDLTHQCGTNLPLSSNAELLYCSWQ